MSSPNKKFYTNILFQSVFLTVLFVGAYFVPFSALYDTWITNGDYSYGILIPLISFYFLWDAKYRLNGIAIKSFWPVFPILVLFVLISIYGILGSSGHIARPAIPMLIILFTIFCFGPDLFRRVSLPVCFLVFMIPLPAVLDRTIGVFLKKVSSELGGMFLRAFGYSVHVSGNVIDLGVTQLQVIDACSGLRFVFPLLALGVVYGYFFEKSLWKRVVCVLVTIPISILTNVLRIGITGILTYAFGSKMAEGFFHDFEGVAIFMVAFAFLFLFGRFLRFFPPKNSEIASLGENNDLPDGDSGIKNKGNLGAIITSVVILMIVGGLTLTTKALPPVKINGGIASFPTAFNEWKGEFQTIDPEIIDKSGAEEAFSSTYSNPQNKIVSLYIGYRSTAFLENVNFFHSPTVCLPSSGWNVEAQSKRIIKNVPVFGDLPVTEMIMDAMGEKQLVYFWFQTKSEATHDKNVNRFHLAMHAIKKDNTHDLFIRPITPISKGETIDEARQRMDEFVREMMTTLSRFLEKNQYEEILHPIDES